VLGGLGETKSRIIRPVRSRRTRRWDWI